MNRTREFNQCVNAARNLLHDNSAECLVIIKLLEQAFNEGKRFALGELKSQCEELERTVFEPS